MTPVEDAPGPADATSYALLKLDVASVDVLRAALQEHFASVAAEPVAGAADAESRMAQLAHITELIRLLEELAENGAAQSKQHLVEAEAEPPVSGKIGRGLGSLLPTARDTPQG